MANVEDGLKAQVRNIETTYGKSIDELTASIEASGLTKHTDIVAMLKQRYGMAHGAAHRVSIVARDRLGHGTPSGPAKGGPNVAPIHAALLEFICSLGNDVEPVPKKGYVSMRRAKQFAMLQPATKWVNVGLVLKHQSPTARLRDAKSWNALFTHRVLVDSLGDIDAELKRWLTEAYKRAG